MRHAYYVRTPSPHTPVKPRGSTLIPFVTPRPLRTDGCHLRQLSRTLDCLHRPPLVFSTHFVLTREHPGRTSRSVTHHEIAPDQARLTWRFFRGRLPKKKVHLGGMSILSILLSHGSGSHNHPPQKIDAPVDQPQARNFPSWPRLYVYCRHICHAM